MVEDHFIREKYLIFQWLAKYVIVAITHGYDLLDINNFKRAVFYQQRLWANRLLKFPSVLFSTLAMLLPDHLSQLFRLTFEFWTVIFNSFLWTDHSANYEKKLAFYSDTQPSAAYKHTVSFFFHVFQFPLKECLKTKMQ